MVSRQANDEFKDFVLDQLSPLEGVSAKRMFSGYGLYRQGVFFGIVAGAALYFKTDDATRPSYTVRGMGPFRPTARQTLKTYHEVPADVLEDRHTLADWARGAIHCQNRAAAPKPKRRAGAGPRSKPKRR
jgi:DNA transformation protein and related proteins